MDETNHTNLGAEAGAEAQNQQMNQGAQNQQTQQEETKTLTTAELNKLLQAESDKRVDQALKTFREKELPGLIDGAKSEAEKLAKMSADQKAEHERQKREDEYARRMSELTKGELKLQAHKTLTEKGMPVDLLDALVYSDADTCNASIEALEKAFRSAVQAGVNERLKGNPPKSGAGNPQQTYTHAQLAGMSQQEIIANMAAVEQSLQQL